MNDEKESEKMVIVNLAVGEEMHVIKPEYDYWGFEGDTYLIHTEKDEAIAAWIDKTDLPLPRIIIVQAYNRVKASVDVDDLLERVLEHLDENYSDSAEDETKPTEAMKEAANIFADAIEREYVPWNCEVGHTESVNLVEWVAMHGKDHFSDWEKFTFKPESPATARPAESPSP